MIPSWDKTKSLSALSRLSMKSHHRTPKKPVRAPGIDPAVTFRLSPSIIFLSLAILSKLLLNVSMKLTEKLNSVQIIFLDAFVCFFPQVYICYLIYQRILESSTNVFPCSPLFSLFTTWVQSKDLMFIRYILYHSDDSPYNLLSFWT